MGFLTLSTVCLVAILKGMVESESVTPPKCPENSTYRDHGFCYLRCDNIDTFSPEDVCILPLAFGCTCDDGFLEQTRTSGEPLQCVRPKDCNVTCGPNKTFVPNAYGCQPTCDEPIVPKICYQQRSPKCVCNDGYILSGKNCVKPTECEKTKDQ
ncbi:IgGFc-binding protein-like [Engystomops pustulosus]|uniref:IgGFc-binding protein-like n=1 Tax=Engystomops pustulosus TaxID=76066 RepID=UPI003AFADE50